MSLIGKEQELETLLIDSIKAALAVKCGSTPAVSIYIEGIAKGIADSLVPFLVKNSKSCGCSD